MTDVLIIKIVETQERSPYEDIGRDWSDISVNQGRLKMVTTPEARRLLRDGFSVCPAGRTNPVNTLISDS